MKPKKFWILTVLFLCVRLASADTDGKGDANEGDVKLQQDRESLVQVQLQADKVLPVEISVQNGEWLPVKLQRNGSKKEPVAVVIKNDKAIAVDVNNKSLPAKEDIKPRNSTWIPLVIAALATLAAWRAVYYTKLVAEGRLFFELICEYSEVRMCDDIRIIFNWARKYNYSDKSNNEEMVKAAKQYADALHPSDDKKVEQDMDRLDKARRHITHYFLNILDLLKGGYVKKSFAERVCKAIATSVLKRNLYLEKALIDRLGELDKMSSAEIKESKENIEDAFNQLYTLSDEAWARGCNLSKK